SNPRTAANPSPGPPPAARRASRNATTRSIAANRQLIAHLFPTVDRSLFVVPIRQLIAPFSVGSVAAHPPIEEPIGRLLPNPVEHIAFGDALPAVDQSESRLLPGFFLGNRTFHVVIARRVPIGSGLRHLRRAEGG